MSKLIAFIVIVLVFLFTSMVVVFSMLTMVLVSFFQSLSKKESLKGQEGSVIDGEYEIVYEK